MLFIKKVNVYCFGALIVIFFLFQEMARAVCLEFGHLPGYTHCTGADFELSLLYFLIGIIPVAYLPRDNSAITVFLWLVYVMHVFPTIFMLPRLDTSVSEIDNIFFALLILISFYFVSRMAHIRSVRFSFPRMSERSFSLLLIALCITFSGVLVSIYGFSFKFASIFEVYEVRREFHELQSSRGGRLGSYLMLIGAFSLVPLSLCISILSFKRHWAISITLLLSALSISAVVYSAAAFKSVAFMPAFVVALYCCSRLVRNCLVPIASIWAVLFVLGGVLFLFEIDHNLFLHWLRRTFLVPGMNSVFYLDNYGFFSFGEARVAPRDVMAEYYNSTGSANSGLYGNALALGGILGVFLNTILLVAYIFLAKVAFRNISWRIPAAMVFPFAYAVSNSALTTSLVSYGGLVTILLIFLGTNAIGSLEKEIKS